MNTVEASHSLDNPIWHALTGPHAHLAIGTDLAKRYPPEVSFGVAVANYSESALADLAYIVPAGETIGLLDPHPPEHIPGWHIHEVFPIEQLVSQQDITESFPTDDIIAMNEADVPDMIQLVDIARPGPFLSRTIEMGHFFGIRQAGQLVAMAGERFRLPGYSEISGVCTHPDWQGKGYASRLCSWLVHDNWRQGIIPYMHVLSENTRALRVYERLHFTRRVVAQAIIISHD